jgi:hypothetical protein
MLRFSSIAARKNKHRSTDFAKIAHEYAEKAAENEEKRFYF